MRDWRTCITAIIGIVIIEVCALLHGMDGVLLSLSIAAISGIAGFSLSGILTNRRK